MASTVTQVHRTPVSNLSETAGRLSPKPSPTASSGSSHPHAFPAGYRTLSSPFYRSFRAQPSHRLAATPADKKSIETTLNSSCSPETPMTTMMSHGLETLLEEPGATSMGLPPLKPRGKPFSPSKNGSSLRKPYKVQTATEVEVLSKQSSRPKGFFRTLLQRLQPTTKPSNPQSPTDTRSHFQPAKTSVDSSLHPIKVKDSRHLVKSESMALASSSPLRFSDEPSGSEKTYHPDETKRYSHETFKNEAPVVKKPMLACASLPVACEAASKLTLGERTLKYHRFCNAFLDKYTLSDILGEGGFGFVMAATRKALTQPLVEVAVKFILKDKLPISSYIKDEELDTTVPFEIFILRRAQHENIIRYLDWFEDSKFFYLVTELHGCEWVTTNKIEKIIGTTARRSSMDLFECIDVHERFSENIARHVFHQVIDAINYLHNDLHVCHRDIKDENLVIDRDYRVKLIDFGAAAFVPQPQPGKPVRLFNTFHGTLQYCAPEILRGCRYRGPEAEVWGLGVLLYTMLFGENPFNDPKNIMTETISIEHLAATCGHVVYVGERCINEHQRSKYLKQASLASETNAELLHLSMQQVSLSDSTALAVHGIHISTECMDLLTFMLDRNPQTRATILQILHDPWFTKPSFNDAI